jgi:hypothetical protein
VGQQVTGLSQRAGFAAEQVSVLAGQVDIVAINGMVLRSPAPGQQGQGQSAGLLTAVEAGNESARGTRDRPKLWLGWGVGFRRGLGTQ